MKTQKTAAIRTSLCDELLTLRDLLQFSDDPSPRLRFLVLLKNGALFTAFYEHKVQALFERMFVFILWPNPNSSNQGAIGGHVLKVKGALSVKRQEVQLGSIGGNTP